MSVTMDYCSTKPVELVVSTKSKKDVFVSIFSLLKSSSSSVHLTLNETCFHVQGMDKSHVCLFELNLKADWFDYYKVDKSYLLCFDTSVFCSIISTKSEDQWLSFHLEEDTPDLLWIELKTMDGVKKADYNKFFKLPLMDYDYDEMSIPACEYDAEFTLPAKKVTDMLSQLANFGDDINIQCKEDCVDFKASGNSVEMRVHVGIDDMTSYAVVEDEVVNLSYSLVYVSKMCITNKLTPDIAFHLNSNTPMKVLYDLGNDSHLVFYIAPKMTED